MLSGIDSVLSQTRSLQKSIFTSQENIGIDVLWKCLIDPIDDEAMRGCLNTLALVTKSASCDSVLVDFRLIFLKFNLLLHIISLVANPSTIAGETFVTQEQLVHCLNETCFLLDILPTLRTGYFALEAEKVRSLASRCSRTERFDYLTHACILRIPGCGL